MVDGGVVTDCVAVDLGRLIEGAGEHHANGEVALGGEAQTECQVGIEAGALGEVGACAERQHGGDVAAIAEVVADGGIEGHHKVVLVADQREAETYKAVVVHVEAVGGADAEE